MDMTDHRTWRGGGTRTNSERSLTAVLLQDVLACLNARKNRVLLIAQSSLPEPQFRAFRALFLNEFGNNGLESELEVLFAKDHHDGTERNGQEQMMQEGRCPHV
jgi:hypothetical protein